MVYRGRHLCLKNIRFRFNSEFSHSQECSIAGLMRSPDKGEIIGSNPFIPTRVHNSAVECAPYKCEATGSNPVGPIGIAPWLVGTTVSEAVRFLPLAMVVRFYLIPPLVSWQNGNCKSLLNFRVNSPYRFDPYTHRLGCIIQWKNGGFIPLSSVVRFHLQPLCR